MKKKICKLSLLALSAIALVSCRNNDREDITTEEAFSITNHIIAGTTVSSKGSKNKSVYIIKFLENNKAVFMNSTSDLAGEYQLTKDSLIVTITDPSNYRVAKFSINDKKELTSAYYKALKLEYKDVTGVLIKKESTNQFAKKLFKGDEYKWGNLNNKDFHYKFNDEGTKYGSGTDLSSINIDKEITENIGNTAFRYKNGNISEIGFVNGDSLTVFKHHGLYHFGTYKLVK